MPIGSDATRAVRLSAALVLGHVDGPEISRALIARLSQPGPRPIEAWVALLGCRDPSAGAFLAQASRHPRSLGQFNHACLLRARIVPSL